MYQIAPYIEISGADSGCYSGWDAINLELANTISGIEKRKVVVVVECYQGTFEEVNFNALKRGLNPNASCKSSHIFKEKEILQQMVQLQFKQNPQLKQITGLGIEDYFDDDKKAALQQNINFIEEGLVLVFGIGASLICKADLLIYADMSQWEIQQRFKRRDVSNIGMSESNYPFEEQYSWAFFNDWPLCNQIRKKVLPFCDYYLETNNWAKPKLVKGNVLRSGLKQACQQPFKLAPFFDPILWEQPDQEPKEDNHFDWCYNCVPDEDNLLFKTKDTLFEVPLQSLIACYPDLLLGPSVVNKYGERLPIHLDFIDTQETGKTQYRFLPDWSKKETKQEQFYYFLEVGEKSKIKVGNFKIKKNNKSKNGDKIVFTSKDQYLQKHDFLSIPTGVATRIGSQVIALYISNSSGKFIFEISPQKYLKANQEVLESSINTEPIPIKISLHQVNLTQDKISIQEALLPNQSEQLDIQRLWFREKLAQYTYGQIQVINLIKGDNILLEAPSDQFPTQLIRRGETFVIPAGIQQYHLKVRSPSTEYAAILKVSGKLA